MATATTASPTLTAAASSRRRIRPGRVALSILSIAVAVIWIFPVYWMVNSSLLPNVSGLNPRAPTEQANLSPAARSCRREAHGSDHYPSAQDPAGSNPCWAARLEQA